MRLEKHLTDKLIVSSRLEIGRTIQGLRQLFHTI